MGRNVHLQIARALAASLVVVDHAIQHVQFEGSATRFVDAGAELGLMGVAAFFTLSGFLMARQSWNDFGAGRNALVFAFRRIVRVVPLYWVATLMELHLQRLSGPVPFWKQQVATSLAFLPNPHGMYLMPLLKQGWTLNYEMFFYAIFAVCLCLPRRKGLTVLLVLLGVLGCLDPLVADFMPSPGAAVGVESIGRMLLGFYTSARILLFLAGVGAALLEARKPGLLRRFAVSPAYLLLLPAAVFLLLSSHEMRNGVVCLCGAAAVFVCTLARSGSGGFFERLMVHLGDASYSTYLIHVWLFWHIWHFPLRFMHVGPLHSVLFVVLSVIVANCFGLIVHWCLERPMTQGLRWLVRRTSGRWFQSRALRPNLGEGPMHSGL
jgi:exopolysaccharide production protein ExoZ